MILRITQDYGLCRTEHLNLNRITLLNKLETSKCEYAHISFKVMQIMEVNLIFKLMGIFNKDCIKPRKSEVKKIYE